MVMHDGSTFYTNDYKVSNWLKSSEYELRRKCLGGSLMVSKLLLPLLWFDFSDNQSLCKMNLNDKRVPRDEEEALHGTSHVCTSPNGQTVYKKQLFHDSIGICQKKKASFGRLGAVKNCSKYKIKKGIFIILQERGPLPKPSATKGKSFRLSCNDSVPARDFMCCAKHLLGSQPNFKAQRSAIHEAVDACDYGFLLYPNFHCELTFIKRYRDVVKTEARKNYDYTFSKLKNCTPTIKIRGYHNKCWGHIDTYSREKNASEAGEVVKPFSIAQKSHCKL
ncbi:MAG: hypothetical protein EXX96DRAFT_537641 [Benjaminiella poitrasii]|nr:MAG: hypothetical protein EXX96DRAFT_537641 [Benjaminiella poitrasii]